MRVGLGVGPYSSSPNNYLFFKYLNLSFLFNCVITVKLRRLRLELPP
ncbi:hypothetical protein [Sulfolobus tengchongensis spindle-shaped virus 3]|nr:hypothetical protein [Sulfolobus tengchongensis spindle-shaped virus 3]